ncbi:ABC transporter permease [Actinospica robiniae]|uniref:ABC transporter permease n=1 Tax=Actinospica robiniae TaxID=304901 RepID=UPI0003FC2ED9|nr:ABC transporter permease [Actinospica robiniae]
MAELTFTHTPPTVSAHAADLKAVLYREYALLARNRVNLILGLTPMLVYLLLVNTSLGNVVNTVQYRGVQLRFAVFLMPMVLAMSVVSASGTTSMALFQEEMSGVATQLWSYPLRRSRFLLGKLGAGVTLVVSQSVVALIVGALLFSYPLSLEHWIALIVALLLASIACNGLYLAAAISTQDYRTFMVLTSVSMPVLVFAAPSLSTSQQLPMVLRWISYVNPVTYAVDGMRDAAYFGFGTAWPSLVVLAALALVGNGLASRGLIRRTENL